MSDVQSSARQSEVVLFAPPYCRSLSGCQSYLLVFLVQDIESSTIYGKLLLFQSRKCLYHSRSQFCFLGPDAVCSSRIDRYRCLDRQTNIHICIYIYTHIFYEELCIFTNLVHRTTFYCWATQRCPDLEATRIAKGASEQADLIAAWEQPRSRRHSPALSQLASPSKYLGSGTEGIANIADKTVYIASSCWLSTSKPQSRRAVSCVQGIGNMRNPAPCQFFASTKPLLQGFRSLSGPGVSPQNHTDPMASASPAPWVW